MNETRSGELSHRVIEHKGDLWAALCSSPEWKHFFDPAPPATEGWAWLGLELGLAWGLEAGLGDEDAGGAWSGGDAGGRGGERAGGLLLPDATGSDRCASLHNTLGAFV